MVESEEYMSAIAFENGLFIIAERTVNYDFLHFLAFVAFFVGTISFMVFLFGECKEMFFPFLLCLVICGLIVFNTPDSHTVVDAFVDPTYPWSKISEKYELLRLKDGKRGIYTFKILNEDEIANECRCVCECRK